MIDDLIFDQTREHLASEIAACPSVAADALPVDTWIARSILQKAIRRGLTSLAHRAAATLVSADPRTLWRRLLVTALEDLGPGEFETTARIVAVMQSRSWRQRMGGDWRVVAPLITQACAGTRDQSANELSNVAQYAPELSTFKSGLCEGSLTDLIAVAADPTRGVFERGVAVLLAVGGDCGTDAPAHILRDPTALFDAFETSGEAGHATTIYREAFRLSGLALAPLCACLSGPSSDLQLIAKGDVELPKVSWSDGIPLFALDQYTRTGKAALRNYVGQSGAWAAFAHSANIDPKAWSAAAGEILFRIEGSAVTARRDWRIGDMIERRSVSLGCFMDEVATEEARSLIRRQLPLIDEHRRRYLPTLLIDQQRQ
jgi:hypothetical protein